MGSQRTPAREVTPIGLEPGVSITDECDQSHGLTGGANSDSGQGWGRAVVQPVGLR